MRTAALAACLLLLSLAPPPAAAQDTSCTARSWSYEPGGSCTFSCNAGEILEVHVRHADPNVSATGTVQCGGQFATCTAPPVLTGWESSCRAQSPGFTLDAGEGTCTVTPPNGLYYQNHADCWTFSALPPVDPVAVEGPQGGTPPVGGGSVPVGPVTVPGVDPVSSPGVSVPATCFVAPCHAPTPVPPVGTPYVPEQCTPLVPLVCAGPLESVPVYGGGDAPAVCSTPAGSACLPPGPTLLPPGLVETPPIPPTVLGPYDVPIPLVDAQPLPGVAVYVNNTGFRAALPTTETSYVEETPVTGPPVPITLCRGGCPIPLTLRNGMVMMTISVNGQDHHVDLMV